MKNSFFDKYNLFFMYKPKGWLIIVDFIHWIVAVLLLILWRQIAQKTVIFPYIFLFIELSLIWSLSSYFFQRYQSLSYQKLLSTLLSWILTVSLTGGIGYFVLPYWNSVATPRFVLLGVGIVAVLSFIFNLFLIAYRYALSMDEEVVTIIPRRNYAQVLKKAQELTIEKLETVRKSIVRYTNTPDVVSFLSDNLPINSTNTKIFVTNKNFAFDTLLAYRYDCIVNLALLNNTRGINQQMCTANEKLPDDGLFVCCFQSQKLTKKAYFNKYPKGINLLMYINHFIWKRLMPKLFWTNRLYFDLTDGKNRELSETEVLGRLYYNGFEVLKEEIVGNMYFVIAKRIGDPVSTLSRRYGPLITLNRIGKHKKLFKVYKLRTMHPYSEYLQDYIFRKNNLQEGGKIKNDNRITTLGAIARKYWLDELPMFINFFKGEMKFVGVRPLSKHYYSLYSKELQELRTQFKPGLFPPFYADMPKTLEDIQNSELRYLKACKKYGTFITDIRYLWMIFVNIVFKKARSH